MNENEEVAMLAAVLDKEMRGKLAYSNGIGYSNRTDFRSFLNGNPGNQRPHPQQPIIPPNYPQQPPAPLPPQGDIPSVPTERNVANSNMQLLPMPAGASQQALTSPPASAPTSNVEEVRDFQIPDYNRLPETQQPQAVSKQFLEDEQEFRDALIKEIKSQKRSINKLNKSNESITLKIEELTAQIKELTQFLGKSDPQDDQASTTDKSVDEVSDKSD